MAHLGRHRSSSVPRSPKVCLFRLPRKLQTFNGGRRPRSEHYSRGTALSISTSAYHFDLVDPEDWLHHATKHDSHDACAGQDVQCSFVTKTSVRAVPWRSSRDGPPGSRAKPHPGTTPHLFPMQKKPTPQHGQVVKIGTGGILHMEKS